MVCWLTWALGTQILSYAVLISKSFINTVWPSGENISLRFLDIILSYL